MAAARAEPVLADRTPASDTLARLGGDEFGLLLFDCDLAEAEQVASKLIEQICSVRFPWEGRLYDVARASDHPLTATSRSTSELMSQADVACYAAKHAGHNRVSVYQFGHERGSGAPAPRHTSRQRLREALRTTASSLRRRRSVRRPPPRRRPALPSCCCDCTIRWQMTPPGAFIPGRRAPNPDGQHRQLGDQRGADQLRRADRRGGGLSIGINLSGNSPNDPLVPALPADRIDYSPLRPGAPVLRADFHGVMNQLSVASRIVAKLRGPRLQGGAGRLRLRA